MQITDHFALEEFSMDGEVPDKCIPVFQSLCQNLLEPLRIHYGEELIITSGYRPPAANAAAHGVSNSQHIATENYCAADWKITSMEKDMRPVFDLIRHSPELQFDQLILEHSPESGTDVIHTSWSKINNRREALEGDTANQSAYTSWPAVAGSTTA